MSTVAKIKKNDTTTCNLSQHVVSNLHYTQRNRLLVMVELTQPTGFNQSLVNLTKIGNVFLLCL